MDNPKVKNWNKKANLGYAKMLERVIKDEGKRNGAIDDATNAAACLKALKKVDSLASGTLNRGSLSEEDILKVTNQALVAVGLLDTHIGNLATASAEYRKALATIRAGVDNMANAGAGIADTVERSEKSNVKKLRGVLVKRTQMNTALDACLNRIEALSRDIGAAMEAGDEKTVVKLMEKANKMKHEFSLLEEKNGELMEELLTYS